jgi:hypothetical protein
VIHALGGAGGPGGRPDRRGLVTFLPLYRKLGRETLPTGTGAEQVQKGLEKVAEMDSALKELAELQRAAQWRLDFVAAENSMGFHAPQELARILGESIDLSRQAEVRAVSQEKVSTAAHGWQAARCRRRSRPSPSRPGKRRDRRRGRVSRGPALGQGWPSAPVVLSLPVKSWVKA